MRKIAMLLAIPFLGIPGAEPARVPDLSESWEIDPVHSTIQFRIRHMMLTWVRGTFDRFSGWVRLDEEDITRSGGEITIDARSINTRVPERDADLRSPNFFDVERYPEIVFRSKRVEEAGKGELKVVGDLTMHGVTKEVTLELDGPSPPVTDIHRNVRRGGEARTKIHRKDFGLTWNQTLESGGLVLDDEVELTLDLEILQRKG